MQNTCFFFFPLHSAGGLLCGSGTVPTDCFSPSSSPSPRHEGHGQAPAGAAAHGTGAEGLRAQLRGGRHGQLRDPDPRAEGVRARRRRGGAPAGGEQASTPSNRESCVRSLSDQLLDQLLLIRKILLVFFWIL